MHAFAGAPPPESPRGVPAFELKTSSMPSKSSSFSPEQRMRSLRSFAVASSVAGATQARDQVTLGRGGA